MGGGRVAKGRKAVERAPLTRELIASVAADLIKDNGIDALTMRTVAAKLGVSAMALYHHVADKDELIQLVGDDLLASIALPDPESGNWRELLVDAVHRTHEALLALPGMPAVLMTRTLLPNARQLLFFCIRQFERAGLDSDQARIAYAGLHQLSIGRLMVETSSNFEMHTRVDAEDELAVYMKALHSQASFDGALAGLLDHYAPSDPPQNRTAPRKAVPPKRKAVAKRAR